jgi:hydroxyethylthiazole kinase-like uncharacterized protein yjeF
MKIFRCEQIKEIDEYTVRNEPVTSVGLMERAAGKLLTWFVSHFERAHRIFIFAGPGNNGGDGLALARMLSDNRYDVEVHYVHFTEKTSREWEVNRLRLQSETDIRINYLDSPDQFPVISSVDIIVDAIFGSGLSHTTEGLPAEVIREINRIDCTRISIDIPSGLFGEDNSNNNPENIIRADYTLSFQFAKLSFMFPENWQYTGEWFILPIGLHNDIIQDIATPYHLTLKDDVAPMLKRRGKFDHKGNFGHGLLVSGSAGKIGASVLGAGSAMRSGIGLLTCHLPSCGTSVIHCSVPEAMVHPDASSEYVTEIGNTGSFSAVGAGPGLGKSIETQNALHKLLKECKKPLVLDADALNILSVNKEWLELLPSGTIITPHPKEFERLAGRSENGFDRLARQIDFSMKYKCILVLKGAYTSITTSEGKVFFNSTGNPGMASAGSGDVLTGILLSLLAQGLQPENAAVFGVFLHGLAGDIAAEESCYESIIASDISEP